VVQSEFDAETSQNPNREKGRRNIPMMEMGVGGPVAVRRNRSSFIRASFEVGARLAAIRREIFEFPRTSDDPQSASVETARILIA